MFVGAEGVPPLGDLAVMLVGLALACGGASALNHVLDADIDRLMGKRTRARPGRRRARSAEPRAGVRARAVGALVRAARQLRERADGDARTRRQPLLRPRLHALAEALDAAEHRDRRGGGRRAAAGRLCGRDRQPGAARAAAVRDRLLLDAAALLGARAAHPPRLRGGPHPDAPRRARRARDDAPDRPLLARARRRDAAAGRLAHVGGRLPRLGARPRRLVPRSSPGACARSPRRPGRAACSTTRWPTWPCSSSPWPSTRC